jgi:hypothetical protein
MAASIAWERAKGLGSFDIVNLDLCGHFAHDPPGLDESIYNAIHTLFVTPGKTFPTLVAIPNIMYRTRECSSRYTRCSTWPYQGECRYMRRVY